MNSQINVKHPEDLSYEEALSELEKLVMALESGGQSLDEALSMYERGQALAARCTQLLDQAELKVGQLVGDEIIDFESN